jgi:hypothetical protein
MMKYLFYIYFCSFIFAADLRLEIQIYARGVIAGKEYAISQDTLYRKTDGYRAVYILPKTITAARFKAQTIETPEYTLTLEKIISVKWQKQKVVSTLESVSVVLPVTVVATANNALIIAYDGLQLASQDGAFLRLLPLATISAEQLAQLRLTFLSQKQNNLSRTDRQYVRLLYRLEAEKRREGPHDQYPIVVPQ